MKAVSSAVPTVYQQMQSRGVSRRDFLRYCATIGAALGLQHTAIAQIAKAIETKKRIPVVWLHFQECTGCSESFIRSSHPIVADILLDKVSLDYSETLQAASGHQAEAALQDTIKKYHGEYLMLVEGSVPVAADGVYCVVGGRTALDRVKEVAAGAKAIIAWGNCAGSGGVQGANPNPTHTVPISTLITDKPVVNVQGCPPIPDVMAGVLVHLLTFDRLPQLDALGRPKAFYSRRVHDTCYRRANYDAGLFVESFDDENAKKGYCLYKMGCKGPTTYAACGTMGWNEGTSFPIKSGHPCIGCTEAKFWDNGPFYQRLATIPGYAIEGNADKLGLAAVAVTGAAALTHAVLTNFRKRGEIGEQPGENAEQAERGTPVPVSGNDHQI
jgi:hydrogenase small subunit